MIALLKCAFVLVAFALMCPIIALGFTYEMCARTFNGGRRSFDTFYVWFDREFP